MAAERPRTCASRRISETTSFGSQTALRVANLRHRVHLCSSGAPGPGTGSIRAQAPRGDRKAPRFSTQMFAARKRSRPRLLLAERTGNVIVYRRVRNGRAWRAPQQPEKGSRDEAAETTSNLESEHQWPTLRALTSPRPPRSLSEPHHPHSGGARRGPDGNPLLPRPSTGAVANACRGLCEEAR
jgi:hypothetical protein